MSAARTRRDWPALAVSALIVFVSTTNVVEPEGLAWDLARGIGAVVMLIAVVAWFRSRRHTAGDDWDRQRYL